MVLRLLILRMPSAFGSSLFSVKHSGMFLLKPDFFHLLRRNQLCGFDDVNALSFRLSDAQLPFHEAMHVAIRYAVKILSVWRKPSNRLFQAFTAYITFCGDDPLVLQSRLLVRKHPENAFRISLENHMNLVFLCSWRVKHVIGIVS